MTSNASRFGDFEPELRGNELHGNGEARYEVHSDRLRVPSNPSEAKSPMLPWVITIAIVLLLGTLYIGSSLLVPLTIAGIAYLALRPMVTRLCRVGLGQTAAAAIVIVACFSLIAATATMLYNPLQTWLADAPESVNRLRSKLDQVAEPLTTVDRAEQQLDQATGPIDDGDHEVTVSLSKPSAFDPRYLINTTGHVLASVAAIGVLAFFMLCSGDDVLNRILMVLPDESRRKGVLETISDIQDNVGRYLAQITIINIVLGVAVTFVMWLVGMPTPYLWGAMAMLFNFIPFIGPIAGTLIVFVAAGTEFESFSRAILMAAAFWLTTAVEGQFVTPTILGRTLKVGSLVVLVAVAFWGFMWGLPGVFLSVPLLIGMREVFKSFDATYPLAVVLGEDPCGNPDVSMQRDCEPVKEDEPIAEAV